MTTLRILLAAAVGLSLTTGFATEVFAKAHDQGVADGTRIDPSVLRGGGVAGNSLAGVGRDADGAFLGVVDANHDMTYGRDVVINQQLATDTRRVKPRERCDGSAFPPGQTPECP